MKRNIICSLLVLAAVLTACDRRPAVDPVSPANSAAEATPSGPIDLSAEIARAKMESKIVFLDFTGSDWCPPCIAFHEKVFSQPEFIAYAKTNLIFLEVDFPRKTELPPMVQATNNFLAQKFEVVSFPTWIMVDGDGKEIWRSPAKDDPSPRMPAGILNPQGFIAMLEEVRKMQP